MISTSRYGVTTRHKKAEIRAGGETALWLSTVNKLVMDVWQQEQSEREMEDNIHRVCDFVTPHVTNSLVSDNICPPRPQISGVYCELFATCWWNTIVDSIHPSLHWDDRSPPTCALLLDFNLHLSVRSCHMYLKCINLQLGTYKK